MMKKIGCAVLAVLIAVLCLTVPALAETDIKLTDEVYPTEIIEGNTFSVYGIVTSENNIQAVTIGVYKEDGEKAFEYTGRPGTKTYDIHNIDYLMTFSRLTAGDYVYKIVATDTVDSNVVLLEKEFKVLSKAQFETIRISGENYPTSFTAGSTFSVRGTITSDYAISAVTCSVRSENGTLQFTKTVNPGTTSYSLVNIDQYMTFSRLGAGTYVYKVTASDAYNTNVVLLEKTFTVNPLEQPEEDYERVSWDVIDLSVWNEIESWSRIAQDVDAVILRVGYRATATKAIGQDRKFVDNYRNAKAQGLPVGCYFFSAALTVQEAIEEAEFVLDVLEENDCKFEMPVYFDMETDAQVALSTATATAIARAFCERIEEGGYYTGIYCNKYFARDQLYANQLADFHFWIAQYSNACTYDGPYGMWQYSETGSINGINGNVDLNYCYYNYPQIIRDLGMSGYGEGTVERPRPTFTFNDIGKFGINEQRTIVYGIDPKMTPDEFTRKYVNLENGATISYTNTVGGLVATGTEIKIKGNSTTLGSYVISVRGDTDMNSIINSSDALAILRYSVGETSLGPARRLSADVTGDGRINSSDALSVLMYVVGQTDEI